MCIRDRARELAATLRACMEEDNANYVSWVEFPDTSKKPSINVAPIDIGQLLHDCLYLHTNSLIMTSATLSVARSFDYFKGRLGLNLLPDKPNEMVLSSPFF